MRLGKTLECVGSWESSRKCDTLDSVSLSRLKVGVRADQCCLWSLSASEDVANGYWTYHAASTVGIGDDSSVDRCLTDEAVSTVNRNRVVVICLRASNDESLISQALIANISSLQEMCRKALSRTSEGHMRRGEGTTVVPIKTTAVVFIPEVGTAPDVCRLAISFDIARCCMLLQHQRPSQQPGGVERDQEEYAVSSLWVDTDQVAGLEPVGA